MNIATDTSSVTATDVANLMLAQASDMGVFNIDDYEDVTSGTVTIKNPATGAPTPVKFVLAGPEHAIRKRASFDRARRMRAGLMKTGKVQLGDPEEDELEETDQLVAFTLGWENLVIGGKPVTFSADVARQLYTDPKRRWLRDQVKAALDEREAFIQRSAAT
jgi:hypothetical protein